MATAASASNTRLYRYLGYVYWRAVGFGDVGEGMRNSEAVELLFP